MFVITGGGSGIGGALALNLAKRNIKVLIIGRNQSNLLNIASLNPKISYLCADVATISGRDLIKDYLANTRVQGLINNAGIIQPIAKIKDITLDDWHKIMATNLDAPLFLTNLLRENLQKGRVLNIGSGAAHFAVSGWAAYCVSKAALHRLTQCLQIEEENIAFASVMPGIIDTKMQQEIRETHHMTKKKQEFFLNLYNQHRLIKPEVVACFLAWLLLDVSIDEYQSQEWDIYNKEHHQHWLHAGDVVPSIE